MDSSELQFVNCKLINQGPSPLNRQVDINPLAPPRRF